MYNKPEFESSQTSTALLPYPPPFQRGFQECQSHTRQAPETTYKDHIQSTGATAKEQATERQYSRSRSDPVQYTHLQSYSITEYAELPILVDDTVHIQKREQEVSLELTHNFEEIKRSEESIKALCHEVDLLQLR